MSLQFLYIFLAFRKTLTPSLYKKERMEQFIKKSQKGFTLVELIIVIAVIGVLAAILIPVFANVIEKANAKSALADARNTVSRYIADALTEQAARKHLTTQMLNHT